MLATVGADSVASAFLYAESFTALHTPVRIHQATASKNSDIVSMGLVNGVIHVRIW